MKTIVLLGIVLMSNAAFAATDCRVVEYPDHYEAVCTGDASQTPAQTPAYSASPASSESPASIASSAVQPSPVQEQAQPQDHQEQTFDALLAAQEAQQASSDGDVTIVTSDLGRRHAEQWLRTQPH